ncbi:MAG TPA: hypothetical protein VM711_05720, partial [Sphingomicrobium sp.]|nr:hypothetical protein [Sphingomicrobium sp.]
NFTGTPMPKDEPLAHNPPNGAVIDYNLPASVSGPVGITITDSSGALVNRFASTDPVKPIDLSKIGVAPEWVVSAKPPLGTPGHHRFVWDLHYARQKELGEDSQNPGVWAPPGNYVVELSVGEQKLRQPIVVVHDPRVSVSDADLVQEFRVAREIEQARVRAKRLLEQASTLKTKLQKLKGLAAADPLSTELDRQIGEDSPIGGTTAPTTLTSISEWLCNLAKAADGADAAPSPDVLKGLSTVSAALDRAETRWNSLSAAAMPVVGGHQ